MPIRFTPLFLLIPIALVALVRPAPAQTVSDFGPGDPEAVTRILESALADTFAFDRLAFLVDAFGPRLSGSSNLEEAIDWIVAEMKRDGLENVRTQEVMVPRWVRGSESLEMIEPRVSNIPVLGLGGSIATPAEGITAEVLVVGSFGELERRAEDAAGKIVLFDVPFTTYGETVQYRSRGAVEAGRVGAVASLIRSVTPYSIRSPHTGAMSYEDGVAPIPHAAIPVEDAEMLHRFQKRGMRIVLTLRMGAQTLPDVTSRNVIGELRGTERPEEVIVVGGHIDSWDVGTGAMDDAGGCVASWEVIRLLARLGLRPKRTIRVVLWTNEENGLRGGKAYAEQIGEEISDHVLALESDSGVFSPIGFGFSGSREALEILRRYAGLLAPVGATTVTAGGGGADIGPIMAKGVPGMGLTVDESKYFWYHHTHGDTFDKLERGEFNRCVGAMASMAYLVANAEKRLPR